MNAWLVLLGALFVVFTLNAVVMWALCRAAALGDRLAPEPPTRSAGSGAQAPRASLPASADEFMRDFDAELERVVWEWSR